MLFLIVGIGREKYAIPACDIIEVAPSAPITVIPGAQNGGAGLVEYRGHAIALYDLGELCRGIACAEAPTTRTLIVKIASVTNLLAIRAERVTTTARFDDGAFEVIDSSGPLYLAGVTLSGGEIIQRIDLQRLLANSGSGA